MKLNIVSLLVAGHFGQNGQIRTVAGEDVGGPGSSGSRMMRKREKMSRKMGYGEVGSLMARQGSSLCSLRSTDPKFQCCDGVDLQCYGCNQKLLSQGEKCDDQTVSVRDSRTIHRSIVVDLSIDWRSIKSNSKVSVNPWFQHLQRTNGTVFVTKVVLFSQIAVMIIQPHVKGKRINTSTTLFFQFF